MKTDRRLKLLFSPVQDVAASCTNPGLSCSAAYKAWQHRARIYSCTVFCERLCGRWQKSAQQAPWLCGVRYVGTALMQPAGVAFSRVVHGRRGEEDCRQLAAQWRLDRSWSPTLTARRHGGRALNFDARTRSFTCALSQELG
jgi:hypothetical protein